MLRRWIAFLVFAVGFIASARASAAVVRDGDELSVDLGAARICWVSPKELRDDASCAGLTPDLVPEPPGDKARVIAMGLVRLEEPGDLPDLGLVMVMHVPVAITAEPDEKAARDYAEASQKAVAKQLRKGARMRPASHAIVHATHHPLIRTVLEADGIPEGADDQLLEHQIHVAGVSDDGVYSVAWLAKRRHADEIARYADASAASFRMRKPAPSQKELDKKIEAVVGVVFTLGTLLVGGVIAIIVVMSRRNKPAPYAYPYPYAAQPSSYPPPAWHPASAARAQHPIPPPPALPRREWWDELQ